MEDKRVKSSHISHPPTYPYTLTHVAPHQHTVPARLPARAPSMQLVEAGCPRAEGLASDPPAHITKHAPDLGAFSICCFCCAFSALAFSSSFFIASSSFW